MVNIFQITMEANEGVVVNEDINLGLDYQSSFFQNLPTGNCHKI